jgi:hypothetical protein
LPTVLRTLTFGDLDSGIWGIALDFGPGQPGLALVADRAGAAAPGATLTADWKLTGERLELDSETDGGGESEALTTVRGRLSINGAEHRIDCLGRAGTRPELDPLAFDSVRDVSAWFAPDDGLALTAARPRGSKGHRDDQLTAVVFEPGGPLPVAEPRLSTTYDAGGAPARAGVELWLIAPGEDAESVEETARYPRRAAGEAAGDPARATAGTLAVQARLFRWHAHGRTGAGVYALVRAR